jgi:hypothetical protein
MENRYYQIAKYSKEEGKSGGKPPFLTAPERVEGFN